MAAVQPLRRLLPKAESQVQPEPFLLQANATFTSKTRRARSTLSTVEPIVNKSSRIPVCFREPHATFTATTRQARNTLCTVEPIIIPTSELTRYRRSEGQQARRQRELAAAMERDLLTKDQTSESTQTVRSRAQKFRRQVEKAQKSLEANPNCDLTDSLGKILDLNIDNFSRHRHSVEHILDFGTNIETKYCHKHWDTGKQTGTCDFPDLNNLWHTEDNMKYCFICISTWGHLYLGHYYFAGGLPRQPGTRACTGSHQCCIMLNLQMASIEPNLGFHCGNLIFKPLLQIPYSATPKCDYHDLDSFPRAPNLQAAIVPYICGFDEYSKPQAVVSNCGVDIYEPIRDGKKIVRPP
ncbi:hypothetical protein C8J57DRAFT_1583938 [Mycena rebaudengoi]|nr:hypothetical protein C8J57DRAFT_1583938 [Mycena rebaudengoi]